MRIPLAEDDTSFAEALLEALTKQGFAVDWARTLMETELAIQHGSYGLLVLDRQFPDGDGASLVPRIRATQSDLSILILTAMHQVADRVEGLDAGADDYLAKPFDMAELMARIRAVSRRPPRTLPTMTLGSLTFDFESKQAYVGGVS